MFRPGLTVALVVLLAQLCSSCRPEQARLDRHIKEIHSLSDIYPDSALTAIRKIRSCDMVTTGSKARFALTYSKVLDKNYIDISSDSIIASALTYFSRRGTGTEKAETFYYAARVAENAGEYEKALSLLQKAEQTIQYLSDKQASLIYVSKARIYYDALIFDAAEENYRKAAEYHLKDGAIDKYASNKLKEADCALKSGKTGKAEEIAGDIWEIRDRITLRTISRYFQIKICAAEKTSIEKAMEEVRKYLEICGNSPYTDWLLIARIHLQANKLQDAENALTRHLQAHTPDAPYYYQLALLYEHKGRYPEALETYKKYIGMHSRIGAEILSKDTKFIEERGMHQEMHEKEKAHRAILSLAISISLLALALAVLAIVTIRKQLKIETLQRENLQIQIDELMTEREELSMLQIRNQKGRRIISERLRIIDQFVMSDAFNDRIFEKKASGTLKKIISDREEFVRQNRLIFNQSSPEFITHLTEKGLDDREIDHCCLYAIGMNGKMVTAFTNVKRHYHIGSDVRKKLGLCEHDTNISIYIRNLYNEFESEQTES